MKIGEYFKSKKELKKTIAKENQFVKDLYMANQLSSDFNIKVNYAVKNADEIVTKILENHNMEISFVPTIWSMLNRSQKIACIMELSKKHCKTPLTYENFIYDSKSDIMFDYKDDKFIINCYLMDEATPLEIMFAVMSADCDLEHAKILSKVENYKSASDFKNFDEIKYYVTNFVDNVPKKYLLGVLYSSPIDSDSKRCKEEMLNIFCNVKIFNKEFEPFYNNLCEQITHNNQIEEKILKQSLGSTKAEQDETILKLFCYLTKTKFNDCNYHTLKQKFLTNPKEECVM